MAGLLAWVYGSPSESRPTSNTESSSLWSWASCGTQGKHGPGNRGPLYLHDLGESLFIKKVFGGSPWNVLSILIIQNKETAQLQAWEPEVGSAQPTLKQNNTKPHKRAWWHVCVIQQSVLGRQRQEDSCGSPISQSSLPGQWMKGVMAGVWGATPRLSGLHRTPLHMHLHTHVHIHTHIYLWCVYDIPMLISSAYPFHNGYVFQSTV